MSKKYKLHIPVEQYGFVEVDDVYESEDEAMRAYKYVRETFNTTSALEDLRSKDFNKVLDKYLTTETLESNDYEELTGIQKTFIQTIKRALKRINSRE